MATYTVILARHEASDRTVQIEADNPEVMLGQLALDYPGASIVSWREEAPAAEDDGAAEDSPSPAGTRRRRGR